MVKNPGSADTQNLWQGENSESRSDGSADTQNLWQGENSESRSDKVINCGTSGPETKKQFKPKSRRGKRKHAKNCVSLGV